MNKLKKSLFLLCSVAMLVGCGEAKDNPEESSSVEVETVQETAKSADELVCENAMECIQTMVAFANSKTAGDMMFNYSKSMSETVAAMGSGDYTEATAIYEIRLGDHFLDSVLRLYDIKDNDLSPALTEELENRLYSSLPTVINGKIEGAGYIATTSAIAGNSYFICKDITKPSLYLFHFENGYDVLATCTSHKDGIVSISTCFTENTLLYQGLETESVREELAPLFAEYISPETSYLIDIRRIK